jgi:hypothetical protein
MRTMLSTVIAVRTVRLHTLEQTWSQAKDALATIEAERMAIDAELAQIATQRSLWEREWQQWLRCAGVLQHGRDYNLHHLKLSAWESDARERHSEVQQRWDEAARVLADARSTLLSARRRCDALAELATKERRDRLLRLDTLACAHE